MYAIVRAGGKQLKVAPGDVVRHTALDPRSSGARPIRSRVSPASRGHRYPRWVRCGCRTLGRPSKEPRTGEGTFVKATVIGEIRTKKVLVFKKKRRKQYRRTKGHRQTMLEVRIDSIEG